MTLRGTIPDPNQTTPIGLNGGRLAEAIKALIHEEDGELYFGNLYMDDIRKQLMKDSGQILIDKRHHYLFP